MSAQAWLGSPLPRRHRRVECSSASRKPEGPETCADRHGFGFLPSLTGNLHFQGRDRRMHAGPAPRSSMQRAGPLLLLWTPAGKAVNLRALFSGGRLRRSVVSASKIAG